MTHDDYAGLVARLAAHGEWRQRPPRRRVRTWDEIRAVLPAAPRLP